MVKRNTNLKVVEKSDRQYKGLLTHSPNRSAKKNASVDRPQRVDSAGHCQVFNSENQAIEALLSQVVGRLEDDPAEQADMKAFLSELLETDPVLREEILSEVTIRSC
jgi:hypothetical protein